MIDITELRAEGKIAASYDMRVGHYCLEAADEIEWLREVLGSIAAQERMLPIGQKYLAKIAQKALLGQRVSGSKL